MTSTPVYVAAPPSELGFAADLSDLLRSVGCDLRNAMAPGVAAIVIAGADAVPPVDAASPSIVVLRSGASAPSHVSRSRVIDGSGSVYDVLERVATPLGLEIRTDVFVSYARRDAAIADGLTAALLERGRRPWVDRRELEPSDKWLEALHRGIEASDTFLYLATPNSVASQWCTDELVRADDLGKRILPVIVHPLALDSLPEQARVRQHLEVPAGHPIGAYVEPIVAALERDPMVVRMHRQLLAEALVWKRDSTQVLRGGELAAAEAWLGAAAAVRDLRPTKLHSQFIAASRAAQTTRRRTGVSVAAGLFAIIAMLAVWALLSAQEARERAAEAQSRLAEQNAFGSYVDWSNDATRALLLAETAVRTAPERDPLRLAYDAMTRSLVRHAPEVVTNLEAGVIVAALAPSLDRVFFRASGGKQSFVAPLTGRDGSRRELLDPEPFLQYSQARFSEDSALLAVVAKPFFGRGAAYRLLVWRSSGGYVGSVALDALGGSRAPEVVGFSPDGARILLQSGGTGGVYAAYAVDVAHLRAPVGEPLYRAPALLLLGQVDVPSSTAVVIEQDAVRLVDAFTGVSRTAPLRMGEPVRQAMLAKGGRALVVRTASKLAAWRIDGTSMRELARPLDVSGELRVWDVAGDGSMVVVLNDSADYPAERWILSTGARASIAVRDRIKTPYVMHAGEEYRPISFVGDRWLLVREPLRNPLEGGNVQQLLLFDRETLQLAAAPFYLPTGYLALRPARENTRFAVVTRDGWVEEWDLLRRAHPEARTLPTEGPLYDAEFLPGAGTLLTRSQVRIDGGLASRLDLWHTQTATHVGRIGELFDSQTYLSRSADGRRLATASHVADGFTISLWDLSTRQQLWSRRHPAPVEAVAFRARDSRIVTAGLISGEQRGIRFVEYDAATGRPIDESEPRLDRGPVHAAFSADGEVLIADYEYDSIALWDVGTRTRIDRTFRFGDPSGMRFDLAYDIVRNLRRIRSSEPGALSGELPGGVTVRVLPKGQGTTIVPQASDTPLLSAFSRTDENLYPVRGTDLLSPSGRWFVLSTNATTVDRASGLRVYDFSSGYPVTELFVHFTAGRPGDAWPRILSLREGELDPVKAVAFLEEAGALVTVTTNGVVRRWNALRPAQDAPYWSRPADLGAALTGRRLISARALQRIPQEEYIRLRRQLSAALAETRTAAGR